MKAVILAGGLGTRLSEETRVKPKPMVEVGGRPILWHIMKLYRHYGINEFVICLGYKGYIIKEYFQNYMMHQSDVTFDMGAGKTEIHLSRNEDWRVTLVETGEKTQNAYKKYFHYSCLSLSFPFRSSKISLSQIKTACSPNLEKSIVNKPIYPTKVTKR